MKLFTRISLVSLVVILTLLMQPVSTGAQVEDVFFPAIQNTTATFTADDHNDLLVETDPIFRMGMHQFVPGSPVHHYDYNDDDRTNRGLYGVDQSIVPNHPFILQFDNTTNDQTVLDFKATYYSLFTGEGAIVGEEGPSDDVPQNIMMTTGQRYGFIINIEDPRPIFI
ncbi:MAG: hypothetical protein ACXAE3_11650, partial [Candidatus Kariarchaeaceae archaeon]